MPVKKDKNAKRVDSKGRILKTGEYQRADGRYAYKTVDSITKKTIQLYSWKLEKHDPTPPGKRPDKALREKIKELHAKGFIGISCNGGGMTVSQLVGEYIKTQVNVSPSTKGGYNTVDKFLKNDKFGKKLISKVNVLDAKKWIIQLQNDGKSYSSIKTIRGVLRPAFRLAVESNLIFQNPFDFELRGLLINDSVKREALSREDEKEFLNFLKNDNYFCHIYDGVLILFKTGLRIGELCGLTLSDVDMENRIIKIDHQLQYNNGIGKNIRKTKTDSSRRDLPMTVEVYEAFQRVLEKRDINYKSSEVIDGYKDFVFLDSRGKAMVGYQWEKKFKQAVNKHNRIFKKQLPNITPHICRHTYCTRMAVSGISVQTLKKIMGHSDITTTLNVYTHLGLDDIRNEVERIEVQNDQDKSDDDVTNVIRLADYF